MNNILNIFCGLTSFKSNFSFKGFNDVLSKYQRLRSLIKQIDQSTLMTDQRLTHQKHQFANINIHIKKRKYTSNTWTSKGILRLSFDAFLTHKQKHCRVQQCCSRTAVTSTSVLVQIFITDDISKNQRSQLLRPAFVAFL